MSWSRQRRRVQRGNAAYIKQPLMCWFARTLPHSASTISKGVGHTGQLVCESTRLTAGAWLDSQLPCVDVFVRDKTDEPALCANGTLHDVHARLELDSIEQTVRADARPWVP